MKRSRIARDTGVLLVLPGLQLGFEGDDIVVSWARAATAVLVTSTTCTREVDSCSSLRITRCRLGRPRA